MSHEKVLNRRDFLRGSAVVLGGTVLAACAPKAAPTPVPEEPAEEPAVTEPTATPPAAPKERAKVTIYVGFGTGTAEEQIKVHETLAEEYNKSQESITAEFLTVPWAERLTKFSAMLAGDIAPELCMPIGVGGTAAFFEEWLDIAPYVERDKYDLTDFVGRTVEFHTYPEKMVGLPMGAFPQVIFYNENIFDTQGVEYPPHQFGTEDWTYDRLVEIGKLLTWDENGKTAAEAGFEWEKTVSWGWDGLSWNGLRDVAPKWGGTPLAVSDDYKTAMVNTPPWVAMVQWMVDTIWKHHIRVTAEQGGILYETSGDPFGSNKVAMWECHSWMSWAYKGWTDVFSWNMAAIPMGPVGEMLTDCDADTFVMTRRARNLDAAWEVAKWFCTPETLPTLADNWGCIPARGTLIGGWKSAMEEKQPAQDWQVMLDSLDYTYVPNSESWIPHGEKCNDEIGKGWELLSTGVETDVQAVFDGVNTAIQGILDDYWKTR
jgi:multiple sugar transport system substrate-binding protein